MDRQTWERLKESPAVVTAPLSALAIPSLAVGAYLMGDVISGDYFMDAIYVSAAHSQGLADIADHYHGVFSFTFNAFKHPPVYLALSGVFVAWLFYIRFPHWPAKVADSFNGLYKLLVKKYYFDDVYQSVFAGGVRGIGESLWRFGDMRIIDGLLVNGTAHTVRWCSGVIRTLQSGYLYDYAFAMIIGLLLLLAVFVHGVF